MRKQMTFLLQAGTLSLILYACTKDNSRMLTSGCSAHMPGKVEQCFGADFWMLSVPSGTTAPNIVFTAPDLPETFKVNGLDVNFEYELLGDSIPYICGCGIAGQYNYAQKIRLCSITTINSQE